MLKKGQQVYFLESEYSNALTRGVLKTNAIFTGIFERSYIVEFPFKQYRYGARGQITKTEVSSKLILLEEDKIFPVE